QMLLTSFGIIRIVVKRACPAAPETENLPAQLRRAPHDCLDAGVEARHITAARQDSQSHFFVLSFKESSLTLPAPIKRRVCCIFPLCDAFLRHPSKRA